MKKNTIKYTVDIVEKSNSEVEIKGSVGSKELEGARTEAIEHLKKHAEFPGFRKGNVPVKMIEEKIGEKAILEEAAEIILGKIYPEIVIDKKLEVISRPKINLTKIARENPLEFTITVTVMPTIKLPDYKKIAKTELAKKEEKVVVTEKDVDAVVLEIQKQRVDHSTHAHDKLTDEEHEKMVQENLPPVTDEFVKSIGEFKDVADFRSKVKENIEKERIQRNKEKKRIEIADVIIAGTTLALPQIILEGELNKMWAEFESDIARMGLGTEQYLTHAKKTKESLFTEWKDNAEKRAKLQLILNRIAIEEKLEANKELLKKEVDYILDTYKGADKERAQAYVETLLINEEVFTLLEKQK